MPTVNYTSSYPNCTIPDPCGVCRLLKDGRFELSNTMIDKTQTKVSLKKVRQKQDGQIITTFPINASDKNFINQNCAAAVISSCVKDGEGGDEVVSITDINTTTGELTLIRETPLNHVGKITIDFGVVTVPMMNKLMDVICEIYESVCGSFPPYATRTVAGIGKASAIDAKNLGKPPVFITTDDANWQMVITALGKDLNESTIGQFFQFLETQSSCVSDNVSRKNVDVLKDLINSLCGTEQCFKDIIDALCGATEVIKSGNSVIGISFKKRFIQAEHGVKLLTVHSIKRIGGLTPTQDINYISPATPAGGGAPLEVSFIGKPGGFVGSMDYDSKIITLPRRGRLRISGSVMTAWNQGITYGKVFVKSGSVIQNELTTFLEDKVGQTRGSAFTNITSPVSTSAIFELTNILEPGDYTILFQVNAVLRPTVTTTETARVYGFSHEVVFVPEI